MAVAITPVTNPLGWDLGKLASVSQRLQRLQEELEAIFPERHDLINQIIMALLTREHVLVHGTWGTGKSDLIDTLLGQIVGARLFRLECTKTTSESTIFGIPNPKVMRETGLLEHDGSDGIFVADLAELDEILDAQPHVLRSLLGVLLGRMFKRGRQVLELNLLTALAATNVDPYTAMQQDRSLGAVLDRFLFHANVAWLVKPEARRTMYTQYLAGATPTVQVTLDELRWISGLVVGARQITDPLLIELHDQIVEAVREAWRQTNSKRQISDRTACKLLQLAEANAVLHGRFEVLPEDFMALRWGVCTGGNQEEHDLFDRVVGPLVEAAAASRQTSASVAQLQLLDKIEQELPAPLGTSHLSADALVRRRGLLTSKLEEVTSIVPDGDAVKDRRQALLDQIAILAQEADDRFRQGVVV